MGLEVFTIFLAGHWEARSLGAVRCWLLLPLTAVPMLTALRAGESALVMGTAVFGAAQKNCKFTWWGGGWDGGKDIGACFHRFEKH